LTDDDGTRGATANQAERDERRCTKPEKFHTRLTSCRTAKLRFSVVAADDGGATPAQIRKLTRGTLLKRERSSGPKAVAISD